MTNKTDFNTSLAWKELNKLLRFYDIKVVNWSASNCGIAYYRSRTIKIPQPTTPPRFAICMHEIKHIIIGKGGNRSYVDEYACEKFALSQLEKFGFDTKEYYENARRYIILCIAKGYCRKLNVNNIPQEIIDFCKIDFNDWKGYKIYVWAKKISRGSSVFNTKLVIDKSLKK